MNWNFKITQELQMWLMVGFNGETEVLHVALFVLDHHVSYYAAN